jgi:hypothetical protein
MDPSSCSVPLVHQPGSASTPSSSSLPPRKRHRGTRTGIDVVTRQEVFTKTRLLVAELVSAVINHPQIQLTRVGADGEYQCNGQHFPLSDEGEDFNIIFSEITDQYICEYDPIYCHAALFHSKF